MILELNQVSREFLRGESSFFAVKDVDFSLDSGDFVNIVGKSGSGKSTLLNVIAGILKPTSGSVKIEGKELLQLDDKDASLLRNTKIGYVSQGQSLISNLNVFNNVRLPCYLHSTGIGFSSKIDIEKKVYELLEQLGIKHLANSMPKNLSGGEIQRVLIARSLINNPSLILADEPTGNLDPENTASIMQILRNLADSGKAVLLVTHDQDTLRYGNATYRMENGTLTPS